MIVSAPSPLSDTVNLKALRQAVYQQAFELLRREFGAKAHFWPRPRLDNELIPAEVGLDFYWRKSNFALVILGPWTFPDEVLRDPKFYGPRHPRVMTIEYEFILQAPGEFLRQVRDALIDSGKYPRLM
jgi:hypothetical protein